jgi:hypothetical protein
MYCLSDSHLPDDDQDAVAESKAPLPSRHNRHASAHLHADAVEVVAGVWSHGPDAVGVLDVFVASGKRGLRIE